MIDTTATEQAKIASGISKPILAPTEIKNGTIGPNFDNNSTGSGDLYKDSSGTGSPSLLVTSSTSRSQYSQNVNGLTQALGSLPVPQYGDDVKDNNGNVVGKAAFNPNDGTALKQQDEAKQKQQEEQSKSIIDPDLKKQFDESSKILDDNINQAKSTLDAAQANLNNDPALSSAIDAIRLKYGQLIDAMKQKNLLVAGSNKINSSRTGMSQYANEMDTNFMSDEMDQASQRVADLVTQQSVLITKTVAAFKDGDVKALNNAQEAYDKANKDKVDAINKLLVESDKVAKAKVAELKQAKTDAKQEITDNIRVSTSIANTVAEQIANSGIKDQKQIDAFLQDMAESNGITNIDVLKSAVLKAQQTQARQNVLNKNTNDIIAKRDQKSTSTKGVTTKGGGTDGGFKYSSDDVSAYANLLNQGGQSPTGQVYNGRGEDKYVDPGAYTAALNDWVDNGGTPQGFVKKFPVTNIDPDDYGRIPEAVRPKTKSGSSTPA